MKRTILIAVFLCGSFIATASSAEAALRAAPAVIDVETYPHGDEYFTVQIINETGRLYRVGPMVGEFDAESGTVTVSGTPYDSNTLVSANIEIPRGEFNLAPGASRSLTGKINVSPYLPPGVYHAVVAFTEKNVQPGQGIALEPEVPRAYLNVTVKHDVRERLNLNFFRSLKKVFVRFPADLTVTLHNGGNVPLTPEVSVRFFDRRDRERGSTTTEIPTGSIEDDATTDVPLSWNGDGGFGRYRAIADVKYGVANGGQILTASTTFWVLPLWLLILIGVLMVVLSYGAARMIVRSATKRNEAP